MVTVSCRRLETTQQNTIKGASSLSTKSVSVFLKRRREQGPINRNRQSGETQGRMGADQLMEGANDGTDRRMWKAQVQGSNAVY